MLHYKNLLILLICFPFWIVPSSFADDVIDSKTFLAEAPKAWKEIRSSCLKNLECLYTVTWGDVGDGKYDVNTETGGLHQQRVSLLDHNEINHYTKYKIGADNYSESLDVQNSSYGFSILKNRDSGSYEVEEIALDSIGLKKEHLDFMMGTASIFDGVMIESEFLESLIFSPGFVIHSCQYIDGEPALYKIDFSSNFMTHDTNTILGGTIWFQPKNHWVIDHYEISIDSTTNGNASFSATYQTFNSLPFLEKTSLTYHFQGDEPIRYVNSYSNVSQCLSSEKDFYLSGYGLPEPSLPKTIAAKVRLLVCAVALALIGIGIYLRLKSRKRNIDTGSN